MLYKQTTATKKLLKLNKRIRVIAGGTAASKTISILLILIDYAQSHKNELISVVSETFPHLKRGAIRDFINIMETHKYFNPKQWNKTDYVYTFETGSKIEFFSADQSDKVRGPRRQVLFINEANNISYETYTQLEIRTSKIIWLDFNPTNEFWAYTELIGKIDCDFITLTYKDNEALEQSIIDTIESRKDNLQWWKVYGEGKLGEIEGRIYTGWQIIKDIPFEARLERRGLDFGYSVDPTVILDLYSYNSGYILDQLIYQKGLSNKSIADILINQPKVATYADSAEPKSIDEISSYGVLILPCEKGQGSVLQGIQYVQGQKISITQRSVETIKAYRNYMWDKDKNGIFIQVPDDTIHEWSNSMDAVRYAFNGKMVNDEHYPVRHKKWSIV